MEGDETTRTWQVTSDGEPMNLSTVDVTVIVKAHAGVEDDDEGAHRLTEGDGLTVTDASQGLVKADIPTLVTEAPGQWLYKVLVELGGDTETAIWGYLQVTDA